MRVPFRFPPITIVALLLASAAPAQPQAQRPLLDWRTFVVPQYGTTVDYPAGIFVPAGAPEKGIGQRFDRPDGRAVLSIYSRDNEQGDTPASFLRKNLRVERSAIAYQRVTRSFFAISMAWGSETDLCTAMMLAIEAYNNTVTTADRQEGVRAFNEKRTPRFQGR